MKVVFIGGGSQHLLPIIRGILSDKRIISDSGEIELFDIYNERAEAMGRMIMKSPEFAGSGCEIKWSKTLEEALPGADAVAVILMGSTQESHAKGMVASTYRNFIASDNISLNGSFLGVKTSKIISNLTAKMEKYCPEALLMDFANPEAVISGLVNNHTGIQAVGVCAGATNHQWDLTRLMGKDEQCTDYDVEAAGINHMSFIMNGNLHGDDLFNLLDQTLKNGLKFPEFRTSYSDVQTRNLKIGLTKMADIYRELGVLMFSSEFDGLMHLCYEESLELFAEDRQKFMAMSYDEQVKSRTRITPEKREELTKSFDKFLDQELDQDFWENYQKTDGRFGINDQHIMVKILQGLSGAEKSKVVVSRPNYGAVEGFKNRTVLEYSNYIYGKEIFPAGKYSIPDSVYGMTSALATHQTMVAEAIGEEDPKKLAQAMLAYPIRSYSKELRELCRELVKINYEEFPEKLKPVAEFF